MVSGSLTGISSPISPLYSPIVVYASQCIYYKSLTGVPIQNKSASGCELNDVWNSRHVQFSRHSGGGDTVKGAATFWGL